MKKILFLFFVAFYSVYAYSQNVVDLGEKFIESDISEVRRHLRLNEQGFSFYTSDEVSVLGHDPNATVIGSKGNNPSNALSVIAIANGASREKSDVNEVKFILTPLYGNRVVSDLSSKGYVQSNTRSFLANNQWTFTEKTYKKTNKTNSIIAVATFSSKGECMSVVFTKATLSIFERQQEEERKRRDSEELRKQQTLRKLSNVELFAKLEKELGNDAIGTWVNYETYKDGEDILVFSDESKRICKKINDIISSNFNSSEEIQKFFNFVEAKGAWYGEETEPTWISDVAAKFMKIYGKKVYWGKNGAEVVEDNQYAEPQHIEGIGSSPFSASGLIEGFGTFNLNGRSVGSGGLPRPRNVKNVIQEDGRVVVNITVAPNGNVIQAEIGRGTNIESIITQECALEAAERAKFNRIQGANNQSGTITYNYTFQESTQKQIVGTTTQSSPFSNSNTGTSGGSIGSGASFNISGRSLVGAGGLPRPNNYIAYEEGRIVVNITVNPDVNVVAAEIGRGTNIDNSSMRNSALDAAKRARFNRIQRQDNQTGTITYNYRIRQ